LPLTATAAAGESLLFSWYVGGLANFKSSSVVLIVSLVLAAYLYAAAIIFLVGIQIDELLRKDASPHETRPRRPAER
jgi:uncharacterized BrkB/YihY/UPF0761 family membrane protein